MCVVFYLVCPLCLSILFFPMEIVCPLLCSPFRCGYIFVPVSHLLLFYNLLFCVLGFSWNWFEYFLLFLLFAFGIFLLLLSLLSVVVWVWFFQLFCIVFVGFFVRWFYCCCVRWVIVVIVDAYMEVGRSSMS